MANADAITIVAGCLETTTFARLQFINNNNNSILGLLLYLLLYKCMIVACWPRSSFR